MGGHGWTYDPIIPVNPSKLFSYFLRPIWTGVINDNDLPVEVAIQGCTEAKHTEGNLLTIHKMFLPVAR